MAKKVPGINVLKNLEIGTDEFQWFQAEIQTRLEAARMGAMALPGWFARRKAGPNGGTRYGWVITEDGTSGNLEIQTIQAAGSPVGLGPKGDVHLTPPRAVGMMIDGKVVELPWNDDQFLRDVNFAVVNVPNDGVRRSLVAKFATEVHEPGRLTLTQGSTTVLGDALARFTRYSDNTAPVATVIRVDAADSVNGNEGDYTIVTITDDGTMTVTPAPTGATENVRFRVKGKFFVFPASGDIDAHQNHRLVWELRTRVSTPPTDCLVAYDCIRSAGVLTLLDRRWSNEYRPMPDQATTVRLMPSLFSFGESWNTVVSDLCQDNIGLAAVLEVDMAPSKVSRAYGTGDDFNGMLLAVKLADGIHTSNGSHQLTRSELSEWPGLTLRIAQASINGISLEQIPFDSGFSHAIAYATNNKITIQRTSDNGTTWVSVGVVWDPTIVNGAHDVDWPALLFTKWGRLICMGVYNTGAAQTIRYIYSDDYGATWSTNGHAGFTALSGTVDPRHIEIVQDGWGVIHGFYIEDNGSNDELWMWMGITSVDPTIDPDRAITANRGVKILDLPSDAVGQPRAIAFDDGTVVVAVSAVDGIPDQNLHLIHVKENEIIRLSRDLNGVDNGAYAGPTLPACGLEASNAGEVSLIYLDAEAGEGGDLKEVRYVACLVDCGPAWPGGR